MAGGWSGDGGPERDAGREQIVAGVGRNSEHPNQSLREYEIPGSELPTTDRPSAHLIAALQKISTIEAEDPSGLRTWKELALSAGNIAREAIVGASTVQPIEGQELISALEKVAALAPVDSQGIHHSWKEMTLMASSIARETIEKNYLMTNSLDQANYVVRNEQHAPARSQGIGW